MDSRRSAGGPLEYTAKIQPKASDGVGYAGFDRAHVSDPLAPPEIYAFTTGRIMFGWPEGGFFHNSIWAPLDKAGHFSFTAFCWPHRRSGEAHVQAHSDTFYDQRRFFPWKQ
jgi:hypothetical protein